MSNEDIISTAVKDCLDGAKEPSVNLVPKDLEKYNCCVVAILMFMRGYREQKKMALSSVVSEVASGIIKNHANS